MNLDALRKDYSENLDWLDSTVLGNLRNLLMDVIKDFRRRNPQIAPPKLPECRVKEFSRIMEKLERKNIVWPHGQLFLLNSSGQVDIVMNDLVGGRLICATPIDVTTIGETLRGWKERLTDLHEEIVHVEDTGYRAHHFDGRIPVFLNNDRILFPVEIQIKTLLQDAWANFGHDEFYKTTDDLPEVSKVISRHLADVLAGIDMIGQAIREEKTRKRLGPTSIGPEETLVTPRTLGYLSRRIFGESMSEVELQRCVQQLKAFGFDSIASVDALARDERIVAHVEIAKIQMGMAGRPTAFDVLFFGPIAAREGEDAVIVSVRRTFGLTGLLCASCEGPIPESDKQFIDENSDLDLIYYCSKCRDSKLRKCSVCGRLTESNICKNCKASDPTGDII